MPKLSLEQIDDICWAHNFLNALPPHMKPYYEWWFWEISHGTITVPRVIETTQVPEEPWQDTREVVVPTPVQIALRELYTKEIAITTTIMIEETITPDEETVEEPTVAIPAEDEETAATEPVEEETA